MRNAIKDGMIMNVLLNLKCITIKVHIKNISSSIKIKVKSGNLEGIKIKKIDFKSQREFVDSIIHFNKTIKTT